MKSFHDLELVDPLLRNLTELGYRHPTPIQAQAIPPILDGRDVLGCAQTGTGKTAAFTLPILQDLIEEPSEDERFIRALILTPTRELAAQIGESLESYSRGQDIRSAVIYGGVGENPQIKALKRGLDVLVATPGRFLDLLGRGFIDVADVDIFVLDEADRMLDMGFVRDVQRILKALPDDRQNLLFSATMPEAIARFADSFLHEPIRVEVAPPATTVELIEQSVMFVEKADKKRLIADFLAAPEVERSLVFVRTKHGANRLVKQLDKKGLRAAALHGNKSQNARERALESFRNGDVPTLIATDIAARGLDIDDVSHVFNYDLPNEAESYVHRIGRTGRAGRDGTAIAFCDPSETEYLRAVERLIGFPIPRVEDHAYHCPAAVPPDKAPPKARNQNRSGGNRSGGNRGGGNRGGGNRGGGRRRGGRGRSRARSASRKSSS